MPEPAKPSQNPTPKPPAKPAAKPGDPPADPAMAALFSDSVHAQMAPCPNCGILLKPGTTICVGCGFNIEKGKSIKTRMIAAPSDHAKAKAVGGAAVAAAQLTAGALAPLFWIAGALVGGAIGAGAWAGVAYATKFEFGWIAIVVGIFTGAGASFMAGQRAGLISGLIAFVVSIGAILGGRFAAMQWVATDFMREVQDAGVNIYTTDRMLAFIADDIATEREKQGKSIAWPEQSRPEFPKDLSQYPNDIGGEAQKRWTGMDSAAKGAWRTEVEKRVTSKLAEAGFANSVTIFHLIYWLVGACCAFSTGAKSMR